MIPKLEMVGGRLTVRRGPAPKQKRTHWASEAERREREPWRAEGYGREYRLQRQAALDRTAGRCARCGKPIAHREGGRWKMDGGETHHSVPLAQGGEGSPLIPLCISCHRLIDAELRRKRAGL